MKTTFSEFKTTDNLTLPYLQFDPDKKSKKVAVYIHGNGSTSIFYNPQRINAFAKVFTDNSVSFVAFNNRGAHYIKTLKREQPDGSYMREMHGTTFELIKESAIDLESVEKMLIEHGFDDITLIGHSSGANKICVFDKYRPKNSVAKYVLVNGGDDTGLMSTMIGIKRIEKIREKMKQQIKKGNGMKLVPKNIIDYIISYQSLFDIIDPEGDYNNFPFFEIFEKRLGKKELFKEFKNIKKPTLVLMSELDEFFDGKTQEYLNEMKNVVKNKDNFSFRIIDGANHSFENQESEVAEIILKWMK